MSGAWRLAPARRLHGMTTSKGQPLRRSAYVAVHEG